MNIKKIKEKMIKCDSFIEEEASKLLVELKKENQTYGNIKLVLDSIPTNGAFYFIVKQARELLQKEIDAITIK